jgi:hypothetical protein
VDEDGVGNLRFQSQLEVADGHLGFGQLWPILIAFPLIRFHNYFSI